MQLLRNNLVVQFRVVGSVITLVLVIGIFIIFSNGFGNIIALLDTHSTATELGVAAHGNITAGAEDVQAIIVKFRWIAFYVITGGLVGLFSSAWLVVLIGWRTI